MLLVVLGAEVAAGEHQDHRVVPLEIAQTPPSLGVVGQLVVGKGPARNDVGAHAVLPSGLQPGAVVVVAIRITRAPPVAPVRLPGRRTGCTTRSRQS